MAARLLAASLLLVLGTSCGLTTSPEDALPLETPPIYRQWWTEVEEEVGVRGAFDRIQWYRVPGVNWYDESAGTHVSGAYTSGRIYLADEFLMDEGLVKHEILHALIGDFGHSHPLFQTYTRGAFYCGPFMEPRSCLTRAEVLEPAGAPRA